MEPGDRRRYLIDVPGGEEEVEPEIAESTVLGITYHGEPYIPTYLVPFGASSGVAESLYERLDRENKVAWLVRFIYISASGTRSVPSFGVAIEDARFAQGWDYWRTEDYRFIVFEALKTTDSAKFQYPPFPEPHLRPSISPRERDELQEFIRTLERSEQEAREDAIREARAAPGAADLIDRGWTPYTSEDGTVWWRHPDGVHVLEVPPVRRRASRQRRRPVRTGLVILPAPTGYRARKKKVAFSVPEMANFAYGGLARGGRDRIQRGRNDRLERIPDDEGRGVPEHPETIEVHYKLFDNLIAVLRVEQHPDPTQLIFAELELYSAGWKTVTTKNRLQTLLDTADIPFFIIQHDWEWYLTPRNVESPWARENWIPWEEGKEFAITLG